MANPAPPFQPPTGITLHNNITTLHAPLQVGCDVSLHAHHRIATCAWVVETTNAQQLQAYVQIQHISSFTTYRSELEGIYWSLRHVHELNLLPPRIQQWCNNQAAIINASKDITTPGGMGRPEADILLAIRALCQQYQIAILPTLAKLCMGGCLLTI
jgi:hypothetical protein